ALPWPSLGSLRATIAVPLELALTAALVVVLAILFNLPSRVAGLRERAVPAMSDAGAPPAQSLARRDLRHGLVQTLAFAGSGSAIHFGASAYTVVVPSAIPVMLATALAADIAAEWRARRRHRDLVLVHLEQRPYAVAPATAALAAQGIEVHARSVFQRSM